MNSLAVAKLLKSLSPDIINLNEDMLSAIGKRRPLLRTTPLDKSHSCLSGMDDVLETPGSTKRGTVLEDRFLGNWKALGGPPLRREYRFDTVRRWRFDFALEERKIAFEIQGGLYAPQSGHRSQEGVERDYEKINAAQLAGWQVFQISSKAVGDTKLLESLITYCVSGVSGV